jgi:hypothetical protein
MNNTLILKGGKIMNDLLEAKLTISRIRTQLLDLSGLLICDHITDKEYAINGILKVVDYIDEYDIPIRDIKRFN